MTLSDVGLGESLSRRVRTTDLHRLLSESPLDEWYWRVAPAAYRYRRYLSPEYVDPPTDPFGLYLVDPDRITRFTGREFPVWTDRWERFGAVVGGSWDRRERPPISPGYSGPDPSLYLAERFTETPLHEGLEEHFVDGVPWQELDFIEEITDRAREGDGFVWQDCKSVAEIRRYCRALDDLYREMRDRGCLSVRELNARKGRPMTLPDVMRNEILIDVSRSGELLFVTGRHRLSLAKILDLDRIPVAVVVRHPEWLSDRERGVPAGPDRGAERPSSPERGWGGPLAVPW